MKGDALIWLVGAIIFTAYCRTLSPSIAGGDSGEIVAEGCELGVAHPPGYPLLTMIIHAIAKNSPIDYTVAMSVNIMSAALTSLSTVFLGFTIRSLSPQSGSSFGAILGMGLFAFSPLIWQYAVTAEVFPLNTLFVSWIVYLVVDFSKRRQMFTAYFGAFLCGLAGCNQHTIILYEVPLILWMLLLLKDQILRKPMILIFLGVSFLLGLSPYFYMPISEMFNPQPGAWGHVTSLSGFLHHFLRRDYGTFQLFSGSTSRRNENMWERHLAYLKDITTVQSPFFVQYFALIGVLISILYKTGTVHWIFGQHAKVETNKSSSSSSWVSNKKSKKSNKPDSTIKLKAKQAASLSTTNNFVELESVNQFDSSPFTDWTHLALIFTQLFYFSFFHSLANLPLSDRLLYGVHQRFWMQPNVLYFCWVGIGFNSVTAVFVHISTNLAASSTILRQVGSLSLQCVALILAIMCVHHQWSHTLPLADQSDQRYFQQYAQAVLSPIPPKAIFMINYDQQWTSVRYMQVCEGFQPQVVSMHMSLMTYPWFYYKRELYAQQNNMSFPGTYLTALNTATSKRKIEEDHAFTMSQFLDANIPPHRVYVGGKFTHGDPDVGKRYDLIPVGLVSQVAPIRQLPNGWQYSHMCRAAWERVLSFLPLLPSTAKYSEETWEWTIGRDTKDRLGDSAAYLLERIIRDIEQDKEKQAKAQNKKTYLTKEDVSQEEHDMLVQPLIDATYWLETAFAYEVYGHNQHRHPLFDSQDKLLKERSPLQAPASLLKNLGLSHVHLLQDTRLQVYNILPTVSKDIFNSTNIIGWPTNQVSWRDWSADHFMMYWGWFLKKPEARDDPQFQLISNLYNQVKEKSSAGAAKTSSSTTNNNEKKPKKKTKAQPIDVTGNIIH